MADTATISAMNPENAKEILQANGMQVSNEQAKKIVDFLTTLAKISLKHENSRPLHSCEYR